MARPNNNYKPKKKELLRIALDLFIEKGYENTTITEIMKAAGLTKAGMYHYFSSKEEMLDEAISSIIEQDISNLRREMLKLSVEEKMILFTKGTATLSDLMQKLLNIKQSADASYAAYRIREKTIHANIPVLEEIIIEGNELGIYNIEYPKQAAEFLVLLGRAIVEPHILPDADREEAQKRAAAYLQLIQRWLIPPAQHFVDIQTVIFEEITGENE
ncbi:MAG: TetR/AcrR family transcriptional regulator [Oscillospiraceae bacterium]|nr:TetR/AcrR family transcriptional regulator [Oscillospiraceae bacterium]